MSHLERVLADPELCHTRRREKPRPLFIAPVSSLKDENFINVKALFQLTVKA